MSSVDEEAFADEDAEVEEDWSLAIRQLCGESDTKFALRYDVARSTHALAEPHPPVVALCVVFAQCTVSQTNTDLISHTVIISLRRYAIHTWAH